MPVQTQGWWLILPAAGFGRRMGHATPKQYLQIDGRSILEITVSRFARIAGLNAIFLVHSPDNRDRIDTTHLSACAGDVPVFPVPGGQTRADSVRFGLSFFRQHWQTLWALTGSSQHADVHWAGQQVLVHDAARPCVRPEDVQRLLAAAAEGQGALLGAPVSETIKEVGQTQQVITTRDRRRLMRALTPQSFPAGALYDALCQARAEGAEVTDESSALERLGWQPQIVSAATDNIKVTHPEDLTLATAILQRQGVLTTHALAETMESE